MALLRPHRGSDLCPGPGEIALKTGVPRGIGVFRARLETAVASFDITLPLNRALRARKEESVVP